VFLVHALAYVHGVGGVGAGRGGILNLKSSDIPPNEGRNNAQRLLFSCGGIRPSRAD
jgi:hypothetical protein